MKVDCRTPKANLDLATPISVSAEDDYASKSGLSVGSSGSQLMASWVAKSGAVPTLAVRPVSAQGEATGSTHILQGAAPLVDWGTRTVWDPKRGKFVVAWVEDGKVFRAQVLDSSGLPEGAPIPVGTDLDAGATWKLVESGGTLLIAHGSSANGVPWKLVSPTGTPGPAPFGFYGAFVPHFDTQAHDGGFEALHLHQDGTPYWFPFTAASGGDAGTWVKLTVAEQDDLPNFAGARLVPRGTSPLFGIVSAESGGLLLSRYAQSGARIEAASFGGILQKIHSVVRVPSMGQGSEQVAVLGLGQGDYQVASVGEDGSAGLGASAVIGGQGLADGALFWVNDGYLALWLARPSAHEIVYAARLTCH